MHGYMNKEALKKQSKLKKLIIGVDQERSLWHKGKSSGFIQKVVEIRIDDDQDSVWMKVDIGDGASCHVGYKSCFYRSVPLGKIKNSSEVKMDFKEKEKKFDPEKVYKNKT